jgi:hypothetical protein
MQELVQLYTAWGKPAEARMWQAALADQRAATL